MRSLLARFRDPGAQGFCLRFAVYTGGFFAAVYGLIGPDDGPFRVAIAHAVAAILRVFGLDVVVHDATITAHGFTVRVIDQCTGIYETGLLAAAVLAFPASGRERSIGVVLGALAIAGVNVVRIASLVVLGAFAPGWFAGAHLYGWQALLIAVVAGYWLAWAHRVRPLAGP